MIGWHMAQHRISKNTTDFANKLSPEENTAFVTLPQIFVHQYVQEGAGVSANEQE